MRVLLVDDDPVARRGLRCLLVDDGFEVVEVDDADAATTALEAGHFDALVTDDQMPPGRRGLVLATEVAARWPRVICVVTSGAARPSSALADLHWLDKPVDILRLGAILGGRYR